MQNPDYSISLVEFHSKGEPPHRSLCTDCGVSRTAEPGNCGQACQFISPDYPAREVLTHGRSRHLVDSDELWFGVFQQMVRARLRSPLPGAQWTGITTRLAERLFETGIIDGLMAVAPDKHDRWKPVPVLVTRVEDVARCRGMRMGYAPLLALLDEAKAKGLKRLAVIGIPCQVYALRALEEQYGFEQLYVIGTPCSDNTTTEHFHQFLGLLDDHPESINYLEFCADYHVELRYDDDRPKRRIPFLKLPLSNLPDDFFPLTCKSCVDYTNSLSDITVGYMAGEGEQWLIVRNQRGAELLSLLEPEITLKHCGSKGNRNKAVSGFKQNVERAAGGLPLQTMPNWVRPIVAWLMPRVGPRGIEFAKARVEMKAIESVIHLRRDMPRKVKSMIPKHVWALASRYALHPGESERSIDEPSAK